MEMHFYTSLFYAVMWDRRALSCTTVQSLAYSHLTQEAIRHTALLWKNPPLAVSQIGVAACFPLPRDCRLPEISLNPGTVTRDELWDCVIGCSFSLSQSVWRCLSRCLTAQISAYLKARVSLLSSDTHLKIDFNWIHLYCTLPKSVEKELEMVR